MKISFITTQQAYWGGSEELWVRMAELCLVGNHTVQVVVYAQKHGLHPALQKLKKGVSSFVELLNINGDTSLAAKGWNALRFRLMPQTMKQVVQFNPDCLIISQANNFDAAFYQIVNKLLLNQNKPFYLISQFNFEHTCLRYADIKKARITFNKAKKIFFVSRRNKEVAERQLAKTIENAVFIDNPLNLTDTKYVPYPEHASGFQFASVARLDVNIKGQDILLQVLSRPVWKEREWHLNVYGTGPDRPYLNDLCEFYGLQQKVSFHGQVDDIRHLWSQNHALLLPSIAEGKPLALQEAMICGRISIASDVGGNGELIEHGADGYLASSFFADPFEQTLEKAWAERHNWKAMGLQAHEKMLRCLDLAPQQTILQHIEAMEQPAQAYS